MSDWILLRGWAREQGHWGAFPAQLQRAMPRIRIETPDLPGNGARHGERSPASIGEMVQALRATPRSRPVAVLGLSMGAMLAIEWARRNPAEVERIVLVNTSARPFARFDQRLRPRHYAALARLLLSPRGAAAEREILRLTSNAHPDDAALARAWAALSAERPTSRANVLRQLVAAARYRAPPRAPAVPVLVLASQRDRLVDVACSQRLAAAWNVTLALHPTAGHDLPLDDGGWIAAQVARWARAAPR